MATILKRTRDTNINDIERWASLIGGAGLMAYGLSRRDKPGVGLAALGGLLAWRGASGHSDLYRAIGVNMAARGYGKGTGSHSGVPYQSGIRIDQEIRINRPVEELYRFWRRLENLPRFMEHLERVREVDDRVSHWTVKGPASMRVEWDAEIVNEVENSLIGWRSLPGSQVDSGGSVRFEDSGNGTSVVKVSLQYNPPAGALGAALARMLGEDPSQAIRQDLHRFKELMETGALTTQSGRDTEQGEKWKRRGSQWEDSVHNSGEESFPASDAPSWTPEQV